MTNDQANEQAESGTLPDFVVYGGEVLFAPGRGYSNIRVKLDSLTSMDRALEAMNVWNALAEAYPEAVYQEPRAGEAVPTGGTPSASNTAAAQPASRGSGGGARNAWPPTVVKTVDDTGIATVGCSYHKTSADRGGGPRPMRDFGDDGFKCTAKSTRNGNDNGFCPLRYPPAGAPPAAVVPDFDPDDLPF